MKPVSLKDSRLVYLLLLAPFILAYVSWALFPVFAQWLRYSLFGYRPPELHASTLWILTVRFFYTWYTFVVIGVAGAWAVAALIVKNRQKPVKQERHPMVSFIVPAYNEEANVSRCISSLFRCADKYGGPCQIIIVDDGSSDYTYEVAWSTIELRRRLHPNVRGKVIRHCANLGKIEAIRTGLNSALGGLIAVVDADSWWMPDTLSQLVDYMLMNGKKAVTGYVHPSDGDFELNPYVVLQQLEYSQGLGVNRCAQSLGSNVLVVSGAIGLYDADILRQILSDKSISSVTEDLEITLEMHKQGKDVGYMSIAASSSVVPHSFNMLWSQRTRWFTGWFHNTLNIHKELLTKKSWVTFLLWYCYVFEYGGAFIDFAALVAFPFLFWFAPDWVLYLGNLIVFGAYGFLVSVTFQSIALKYAYNDHNYRDLLFYTPFYPILRIINIFARLTSSVRFLFGYRGKWYSVGK
jgi:cellulose synthase/poly-beta-1,6-N-acetylglucosamine synthase-like glycosyltransferase